MASMSEQAASIASHRRWRFFRSGGFDQVLLETGTDLLALERLDQKLWAALTCPTQGLEFDTRTLELIDTDGDGRIRAPEIIAAVKWAGSVLKDPGDLVKGATELALSAIDEETPEGAQLAASARRILANLGKPDAAVITAEDTADPVRIFAGTRFNGDGIVPAHAAGDDESKGVIADIIACLGAAQDRSGDPGITQDMLERFFADARAYSEWWRKAENDAANVLPFGNATAHAAAIFAAVEDKVDDYFVRCRLAAFDPSAAEALNPAQPDYRMLASKDLSASAQEVAALPLARVEAGKPLPLGEGVNPAWTEMVNRLRCEVVEPLFGDRTSLSSEEWAILSEKFAAHQAWLANKEGSSVEQLGRPRIRRILSGHGRETIEALIERDKSLEPEADAIAAVDRLVHYQRDLFALLNNFVSFRDFYTPGKQAVFQAGTLYLDGRSCELCVRVDDPEQHASLAELSRIYLAYCECAREGGAEKMCIAAAFTDGDSDNLMVGRNGLFYDRKNRDWDATIIKIVEHPISIRQAFWSPYKRIGRLIGEQIEKIAAAREKALQGQAGAGISGLAQRVETRTPAPSQPFDVAKFAGVFAAIGLALGAVGTAIAAVVTGFFKLSWWEMPVAVAGLILVISAPSVVIAALKLRKRNLGPLLDANGWAVNTRAKINIPFGASLTGTAKLPAGARRRAFRDPYSETPRRWKRAVLALLALGLLAAALVLWHRGYLEQWWRDLDPVGLLPRLERRASPAALVAGITPAGVRAPPVAGLEKALDPGRVRRDGVGYTTGQATPIRFYPRPVQLPGVERPQQKASFTPAGHRAGRTRPGSIPRRVARPVPRARLRAR